MHKKFVFFLILFVLLVSGYALAEDVTITTYYPSPAGVFKTLSSTNTATLATGGSASDRVGIGTTSPSNKLSVNGNADFTGNVGIGTTSPSSKLDVNGQVMINDGAYSSLPFRFRGANTGFFRGGDDRIEFVNSGFTSIQVYPNQLRFPRGTAAAPGFVLSDSTTTGIFGPDGTYQQKIGFAISGAEKMRIDNSGNVGIGTTTVSNKLDVEGAAVIGSTYSGTTTAPSNGLLVEGSMGIGTVAPNASAVLDVNSSSKGLLPPRLTTTQRDAIASPAAGLVMFNSTTGQLNVYNGSGWAAVGAGLGDRLTQTFNTVYQAATDGFITSFCFLPNSAPTMALYLEAADSTPDVLMVATMCPGSDACTIFSYPTKAGEYYSVNMEDGSCSSGKVEFTPLQ